MMLDMLYRHWVTIFAVLIFSIKLWPRKNFKNTETKYFWMTVISCLLLVFQDTYETVCAQDPQLRFLRTLLSVLGYFLRSTAALGLLLVVVKRDKRRFIYWVPALITLATSCTAFFSDIAFGFDENYGFYRGPLGYVAFAVPILYLALILGIVIKNFSEKSSLEKYIVPVCAVFCLSASFVDVVSGGVRTNEAIIISSIFFYLVLFANDNRRDSLTGLLNRQAFYDDCNLYSKNIGAAVSLDMNGLKDLNDTLGHQAGDEALKTIGECIYKVTNGSTIAYRIGGDEFIILFLHSNEKEITAIVDKIVGEVTGAGYSISAGHALREKTDDIEDVIRKSDNMMYSSKADYYRSKGMTQRVSHYQVPEEKE